MKATKDGKRFCPDSKGIPEQVIEEAFVESYRMLCRDNKDVLEEFLKRTEKALGENSVEDQLNKLQKKIDNLSYKRKKLLDNYLSGIVEQDIYEETDVSLKTDLSNAKAKLEYFQQQADEESSLQKRIADFKKALSHNEVLEEFDRGIFESIIEKVIVGGYDENGEKDPYKITFIYKTGFKNEIGNAKERFDKSKSVGDKAKELCSHIVNEVKDVCSYVSDNTYRDEGMSYHYASPKDYIQIKNAEVMENIFKALELPYVMGKVWTTDAIYRETRNLVEKRKSEGCIAVEMELAGMQAVCDFYNIELYDFLVTGDIVDQLEYTSEGLHDANHNLDKFYVALKIAEMINKG